MLRRPNVLAGYWGLPVATEEAFRGGWFHTGDLGRVDAEGFITLVDRKKDMIITGGENVYPIDVEQVPYRHPAVREVAVVEVADDRWGETPVGRGHAGGRRRGDDRGTHRAHPGPARPLQVPHPDRVRAGASPHRHWQVLKTVLRQQHGGGEQAVGR